MMDPSSRRIMHYDKPSLRDTLHVHYLLPITVHPWLSEPQLSESLFKPDLNMMLEP